MIFSVAVERALAAKAEKLQQLQAETWAAAALEGAVDGAPMRGETKYATGHGKASMATANKDPRRYDAGRGRSVYKFPRRAQALFGITGRRHGDDVVLDCGVPHAFFLEKYHGPIRKGFEAGRAALRREREGLIRKANRAGKSVRVVLR